MSGRVGVVGLGVIGAPIARRLVEAGYRVAVFDIVPDRVRAVADAGAIACASSADVASLSEIVLSLVFDVPQTQDVVFGPRGLVHALRPGTLFATGSTLGPAPVREIAEELRTRGCATLDMPITGGYLAAAEGRLVLMVGGGDADVRRAMPMMKAFAHIVHHAGGVGAGQAAKLAHQLVMAVNIVGLLEGLSLGKAGGVDPQVMRRILRDGIADSGVLRLWDTIGPRWKGMLAAAPPGTAPPNLRKDLHSALDLAEALGMDLALASSASRIADAGRAVGHDDPTL